MDLNQATQLLTWLDEEHRKDKAQLAALQSQLETQKAQILEQSRQFQDIQATLTRIESYLPRFSQLETSIQTVRTEFAGLLAKHAAEQDGRDEARSRTNQVESETMARIVRQLQERVEALGSFDSSVALLREDDSRLRSEITRSFNQLTEVVRRLETHDERMDLLSKDGQGFRDTLTTTRLAHEELVGKHLELKADVEALGPRLEAKVEQAKLAVEDSRNQLNAQINALQLKYPEWDRQVEDLRNQILAVQAPLARWTKQVEDFAAQFERNRKTLSDLHDLEKHVREQGNELQEMQRLSAERQRAEIREWQDSQTRVEEDQTARISQLESRLRRQIEVCEALEQRLEENKREIATRAAELGQVWADYVQGQGKLLQSLKARKKS